MGKELVFIATVILLAISVKGAFERIKVPPLIAYLALGFLSRLLLDGTNLIGSGAREALEVLGLVGVTVLLFRVGLKSHPKALLGQLRRATPMWFGNVVVSAVVGYATASWILGWDLLPSIVVAIALTATSVGVAASVWQDAGRLDTEEGDLFVDVAELDDISGVVAVAALLSLMAALPDPADWTFQQVAGSLGIVMAKLLGFIAFMCGFAQWVEPHTTRLFERVGKAHHPMLLVVATGLVMAGLAQLLGLSVAVGAFFAGLAYSRDPVAMQEDRDFDVIYNLFVPFFFIQVGLQITPAAFGDALVPGLILTVAGVVGKLAGNLVPGLFVASASTASLLAVSMIPRAEIALLVSQQATSMGHASREMLSAMTLVAALTCSTVPWFLKRLLERRGTAS